MSTTTPRTTPRRAETDDGEVVAGHALAAALPAIHPLAAVGVLVLFPDRLRGLEQVLLLGEEVVVRVEHAAAEAFGGEIEEVAEVDSSFGVRSRYRSCATVHPRTRVLHVPPRTHVAFTTPCSFAPR